MNAKLNFQPNDSLYEQDFDFFYDHFANDNTKYALSQIPFIDKFNFRRVMDFGIIPVDSSMPKVAILIRPSKSELSNIQQADLNNSLYALAEQNWITLVFTQNDFENRIWFVIEKLEEIFKAEKKREWNNPTEMKSFFSRKGGKTDETELSKMRKRKSQ